jgi:hypothetical protein
VVVVRTAFKSAVALAALTLVFAPASDAQRRRPTPFRLPANPYANTPAVPELPDNPYPLGISEPTQGPTVPDGPEFPTETTEQGMSFVTGVPAAPPGDLPAVVDFGPAPAPTSAPVGEVRRYLGFDEEDLLRVLRTAPVRQGRNVGHTSVNFRVRLNPPVEGAFKPAERLHPEHYRAEVGAYRLNVLLGLERVPPVVFRRVPEAELPGGLAAGVFFDDERMARGAMIFWVPVLRRVEVTTPEAMAAWSVMLRVGTPIAPTWMQRCEEVSTLLVFDMLLANWDRWNGLNALADQHGRLVYRDNNAGFQVPLAPGRYATVLRWLRRSERFSRSLLERVRALTLASLREAMAPEADRGRALLSDAQLRGVLDRRDVLVRYVDGLVARHGEAAVYVFP